jgi:hypothetical protein
MGCWGIEIKMEKVNETLGKVYSFVQGSYIINKKFT